MRLKFRAHWINYLVFFQLFLGRFEAGVRQIVAVELKATCVLQARKIRKDKREFFTLKLNQFIVRKVELPLSTFRAVQRFKEGVSSRT